MPESFPDHRNAGWIARSKTSQLAVNSRFSPKHQQHSSKRTQFRSSGQNYGNRGQGPNRAQGNNVSRGKAGIPKKKSISIGGTWLNRDAVGNGNGVIGTNGDALLGEQPRQNSANGAEDHVSTPEIAHHKEYSLRPRAPPALTQEDVARLGHTVPGLYESTDHREAEQPSFSGRDDPNHGALQRRDFGQFVQFFRMSSPYITGHRDKLFIICIPGEVVGDKLLLRGILQDVSSLHSLGIQLIVTLGTQHQVDERTTALGRKPRYVGGYRVTSQEEMAIAVEASGAAYSEVMSQLSKALAVSMIRRHTRTADDEHHYKPMLSVVSGNFITGRRRGTVDGIDFGSTGSVRYLQIDNIRSQLDMGNIVLLSNLAFSASGEILCCNMYDVATHAAIELGAEKLICLTQQEVIDLGMPQWLSLTDAEDLVAQHVAAEVQKEEENPQNGQSEDDLMANDLCKVPNIIVSESGKREMELELDLDCWKALRLPNSVVSAVVACKNGVKRTHLIDARIDGGMLLELYSRDGVGTMISTDFYEGIRPARASDLEAIVELLEPLVADGTVRRRTHEEVLASIPLFTVVEREDKVLACVLVQPLGRSPDGVECAELAAFCVHSSYRGSGRGDSLLDYVEQDARLKGTRRLVLLTTRTADWFEQRQFQYDDFAHQSQLLPKGRRDKVNPQRGSRLYSKILYDLNDSSHLTAPAGKRIGF